MFERYKAGLVAPGIPRTGLDFNETLAPVVRTESVGTGRTVWFVDYSHRCQDGIFEWQQRFQMDKAKPVNPPLNPSIPFVKAKPGNKRIDIKSYQELTGSLNHVAVLFSRPGIEFAVSKLSRFNSDPTETHMKASCRVLAYLKGTNNYSIVYGDADIDAYTGAIHLDDYLSILGFDPASD